MDSQNRMFGAHPPAVWIDPVTEFQAVRALAARLTVPAISAQPPNFYLKTFMLLVHLVLSNAMLFHFATWQLNLG